MVESEEEKAQVQMNTQETLKSSSLGASELKILRFGTLLPRHLYGSSFTSFSSQLKYRLIHEAFHDRPITNNELSPLQYPSNPYLPYCVVFFPSCFLTTDILYVYFLFYYPTLHYNVSSMKRRTLFYLLIHP